MNSVGLTQAPTTAEPLRNRGFSFKSDRSGASKGSKSREDPKSSFDKQRRDTFLAGHKSDPNAALNELQPAGRSDSFLSHAATATATGAWSVPVCLSPCHFTAGAITRRLSLYDCTPLLSFFIAVFDLTHHPLSYLRPRQSSSTLTFTYKPIAKHNGTRCAADELQHPY
jgi:hypothetical protein